MGRMYSITFQAQSITTANADYDLFEIAPADDKPVALHWVSLGQTTELGDSAEEQLRIAIIRGHATGGNGSAATVAAFDPNGAAAGAVCETVGSTIASAGSPVTLAEHVFNVRIGLDLLFPPECRPYCTQGQTLLTVRLMSTVADDLTMSGTCYFEEVV